MQTIINTRADLDALAGTPEHDKFMAVLRGSLWRLEKNDTAATWQAVEDDTTIERFGFVRADFPNALAPELPAYVASPDPAVVDALAKLREIDLASIRALREYVAAQPNTPQIVKDKEAAAAVERGKL